MTNTVLLDTHIALWLDCGDERLRQSTRGLIDRSGGTIVLSAVTAWEIALWSIRSGLHWMFLSTHGSGAPLIAQVSKLCHLVTQRRRAHINSIISSIATLPIGC